MFGNKGSKSKLNSEWKLRTHKIREYYHAVCHLLSSCLLRLKIKVCKTTVLPVVLYVCVKLGLSCKGKCTDWGCLQTVSLGEYLNLRWMKWWEGGENCMKSSIICLLILSCFHTCESTFLHRSIQLFLSAHSCISSTLLQSSSLLCTSLLTWCIRHVRGLPLDLLPPFFISSDLLGILFSSIPLTCLNHLNVLLDLVLYFLYLELLPNYVFLILSLLVFPTISLRNVISNSYSLCFLS
jgi:hypothetical protein